MTTTLTRQFERQDIHKTLQVLSRMIHYLELEDEMAAMRYSQFELHDRKPNQLLADLREERRRLLELYRQCDAGPMEQFRAQHPQLRDSGNSPYCGNPECCGSDRQYIHGPSSRHAHGQMWGHGWYVPGPDETTN